MKKFSIYLTSIAVCLCLIAVVALAIFAQPLADWYVQLRNLPTQAGRVLAWAYYLCAPFALIALACLLSLLTNIRRHDMFSKRNSILMAVVSWCCLAIAIICTAASSGYMPLIAITAIMIFLFLIVRVVRGCFVEATALREDQDLTI